MLSQKATERLERLSMDIPSHKISPIRPNRGDQTDHSSVSSSFNIEKVKQQQEKDLQRIIKKFNFEMDSINKNKVMQMEQEAKFKAKQDLLEAQRK